MTGALTTGVGAIFTRDWVSLSGDYLVTIGARPANTYGVLLNVVEHC